MEMLAFFIEDADVEYLDGQPYPKVSPKRTHGLIQRAFLRALKRCATAHGEFAPEWRFDVGAVDQTDSALIPDVGFISFERIDKLSDSDAEEPPCSPDLAIEIRSPASRPGYIRTKIERYLRTGATIVLDVDPADRVIHAHSHEGARTYGESERFEHSALPWLRFEVAEVFPKPRTRR